MALLKKFIQPLILWSKPELAKTGREWKCQRSKIKCLDSTTPVKTRAKTRTQWLWLMTHKLQCSNIRVFPKWWMKRNPTFSYQSSIPRWEWSVWWTIDRLIKNKIPNEALHYIQRKEHLDQTMSASWGSILLRYVKFHLKCQLTFKQLVYKTWK